jgi:hypothetical protein
MPFSKEMKIKVVSLFLETKSPTETQRRIYAYFGVRVPPLMMTIHRCVKKFEEEGFIADRPRSGWPKVTDATKEMGSVTKFVTDSCKMQCLLMNCTFS